MAECISIRGAGALFIRDPRQQVTRAVIEGADPTELNVEGIPIRLGHIRFNPASLGSAKWIVDVFAWTAGPLDESLGVKVLARLRDRLAFEPAYLTLRHDPWFIDDEFHPLFHPFYPEIAPPTREQFETSGTLLWSTRPGKEPLCRLVDRH